MALMDDLRAAFHVEQPQSVVWQRLRETTGPDERRCRVPGFPSADGEPGCLASVLASEPQKSLRLRKDDAPCAGSWIHIVVGPANASGWPTHVAVAQFGLPPALERMGDAPKAHWRRIVADFRLYLDHGVHAPPVTWGADFGASLAQTPTGLAVTRVEEGAFAGRCGMREGDLLVALRGVRTLCYSQLWSMLALTEPGDVMAVQWVRDGQMHTAAADL